MKGDIRGNCVRGKDMNITNQYQGVKHEMEARGEKERSMGKRVCKGGKDKQNINCRIFFYSREKKERKRQ